MSTALGRLPLHWLTLVSFARDAAAFWRMNCAVIQTSRVDPIVNPGNLSQHTHNIVGGINVGAWSNFSTLVNSSCSSCEVQADKSAYWTPLLYYRYPDGTFIEVPHGGSVVYYLARGPLATQSVPFPPGFQMVSGDKSARSYDNTSLTWGNATYPGRPIADRVSFNCLADGPPLPERPYMFNTNCLNGMRAQIHFQTCWDGKNLYKPDNSHVAYLSGIDDGVCPPGYPVVLPHLFMETNYAVAQVPNQVPGGLFVFSHGDATGYGFHGDFQNGWEIDVQAAAVASCLVPDNFGQLSYCPPLYASYTNGYAENCPEQPSQVGEQSHGTLSKLPGCINITYGPEAAPPAAMACPASVVKPSLTRTVDTTPQATRLAVPNQGYGLTGNVYLSCFNDSAGGIRTLNAFQVSNYTVMTIEYCQALCKANGYRLSGVEYAQECHCDNGINPTAIGGSIACTWKCGGTMTAGGDQEICGGLGYISVYNNTDPNFVANGTTENSAGNVQPYSPTVPYLAGYAGCYSDSISNRTLVDKFFGSANMTWQACASFCSSQGGYQYYGLEYTSQCYCGNKISSPGYRLTGTTTPSDGACSMRCKGSEPQICGGDNALTIYRNTSFPAVKPKIGQYQTSICLSDPNTRGRALQGSAIIDIGMTNEKCVKLCLGQSFHYAGVENGSECYCGHGIEPSSGAQTVVCPTALSFCSGNRLEYCGAANVMSLYYSPTL